MQQLNPEGKEGGQSSSNTSPMKGVIIADSSQKPHIQGEDEERGDRHVESGNLGLKGAEPKREANPRPNDCATSSIQMNGGRQQGVLLSNNQGFGSSSGTAATMLMAANTLAQTPAQSVSNALLGKVQMVAAAEQQYRRSSLSDSNNQVSNGESYLVSNRMPSFSSYQQSKIATESPLGAIDQIGNLLSNPMLSSTPQSPRSVATFQVGSIATKAAAHEYLKQVSIFSSSFEGASKPQSVNQDRETAFSNFPERRWDANNPFQGVPSLPCESEHGLSSQK